MCDDCVTKNVPLHTYFDIELYNAWMEVFFMPLASDDPDINDSRGHLEGDHLLVDVASILKELTTNGAEIYRVGGNEFMIITPDTDREDFDKYAQTLRDNCERPDRAHFALGACHSDEAEGGDVRKAMQRADALMYEVKAEYYTRHPEMEWHNKIS